MYCLSVSSRPRFRTDGWLGEIESKCCFSAPWLIRGQDTLGADGWRQRISDTPILSPRDRDVLQLSSPTGVKLMADHDERAEYAHMRGPPPNAILRPDGTR